MLSGTCRSACHNGPLQQLTTTMTHIPCSGHQSFSTNKQLNDVVGLIVHSSIGVPYHGWRISHRTHHNNHGHVENDESWYPPS